MPITTLFWDIGGVLLSNAWDHVEREQVLSYFRLDEIEFRDRHELLVSSFERGKITLDEYLDRTVFYRERGFSREEFKERMFAQSQACDDALQFARAVAGSGKYLIGTINNESRELNAYRIEKFGLKKVFTIFISSCYVGMRKPEEGIYRLALEITQRQAEECVFIDDRPLNLESAAQLGMNTVQMKSTSQLREDLQKLGISV
jgi:putative hydrolase of the HAD superfamily